MIEARDLPHCIMNGAWQSSRHTIHVHAYMAILKSKYLPRRMNEEEK